MATPATTHVNPSHCGMNYEESLHCSLSILLEELLTASRGLPNDPEESVVFASSDSFFFPERGLGFRWSLHKFAMWRRGGARQSLLAKARTQNGRRPSRRGGEDILLFPRGAEVGRSDSHGKIQVRLFRHDMNN